MLLNPHLSQVLELYDPQRLHALLLWLNSELKDMLTASEKQTEVTNIESAASIALPLDELVQFSILNEFGLSFCDKAGFPWLKREVSQKIAEKTH
ncbi:hypothetical protein [Vampirovibrio sp.]|uniref:hypothetical protein n=1 Tax=Vampirovibrio sp. TaxID=2717857 RepID=UPI00359470BE